MIEKINKRKTLIFSLLFLCITFFQLYTLNAQMDKRYEHLVFQDADIKAIFQFLANESGINIVVNPDVTATVTLDLRNITLQRVIDILLESYDLTMIKETSYYRVMNTEAYRAKQRDAMNYEKQKKDLLDTQTRVFQVEHAKAGEITGALQQGLSHRGTIVTDERSNSIIITDIPEQFSKIETLLEEIDVATKQVKVSAKILLVDKSFLEQIGIKWQMGKPYQNMNGQEINAISNRQSILASGIDNTGVQTWSNADQVAEKLGNFTWGIMTGEYALQNTISAILSRNSGEIIDQPDITTMDNTAASIFSGEEIPISVLDEAGNTLTRFYNVGTTLDVTPHITVNDRVMLDLNVERNAYTPTSGGYSILKRTAQTTIIIGEDETAVIGGVQTIDTQEGTKGIPILMDLPLIGRLFRYTTDENRTKDLVIFVSAEILD